MVYKHAYLNTLLLMQSAFMLSVVKIRLKGEVGGYALISHGNYIMEKSWNCVFEFLWEPCYCDFLMIAEKMNGEMCSSSMECLVTNSFCDSVSGTCSCAAAMYLDGLECLSSKSSHYLYATNIWFKL